MFPYDETRISCGRLRKSRRIWRNRGRWIVCCAVMLAMAKRRSLFALPSRQRSTASRWRFLCRRRFWRSSIMRRSVSDSPAIPFNVQVLSRFRSKKEQNETMKGVKAGTVDVVIGTHRLLSQDIIFKDLGLADRR